MNLNIIRIKNFRRLKNVVINLEKDISIFVGANNSGKTSVSQALQLFLSSSREKINLHDFSSSSWAEIESFSQGEEDSSLPEMMIDFWFNVKNSDLHRVIDLLPSLSWQGSHVGIRIVYSPVDPQATLKKFETAREEANSSKKEDDQQEGYEPFPKTLTDFLTTELSSEYEFRYYVLDKAKFDSNYVESGEYEPLEIIADKGATGKSRSGKDIISSLMRVDFLHAQRHLSDTSGGSRSEELSRHLSRFYKRNLKKRSSDYEAMRALTQSEQLMNEHLEEVFSETLKRLSNLGYPGIGNPNLKIMSDLNPAVIMSAQDGAKVHYVLDDNLILPDKYNGLGFKNLIYMVVELLDLHNQWVDIEENRPPLHLVFIEEPEAHLHTQLQQVFVNNVLKILSDESSTGYVTQLILTTHSPHILYERGFKSVRYFRREGAGSSQSSRVLNLSDFHDKNGEDNDFLERYLKLTHCDLFFADAAILVEGNVERLLLPLMIEKSAPRLKEAYLTILEIGGAFGHRFKSLIEFLGITTLIVTDLDSVHGGEIVSDTDTSDFDEDDETDDVPKKSSTCPAETPGAVTSNQTLLKWLPKESTISNLLGIKDEQKIQPRSEESPALVRISYQKTVSLSMGDQKIDITGRTLEEAFAFENLTWSQDKKNKELKLRVKSSDNPDVNLIVERLHKRIRSDSFKKTDFALALLSKNPDEWQTPSYIEEGLKWLENEITANPQLIDINESAKVDLS